MKKISLILFLLIGCVSPNVPQKSTNLICPATFSGYSEWYRNGILAEKDSGLSINITECDSVFIAHQTGWITDYSDLICKKINSSTYVSANGEDTINVTSNSVTEWIGNKQNGSFVYFHR